MRDEPFPPQRQGAEKGRRVYGVVARDAAGGGFARVVAFIAPARDPLFGLCTSADTALRAVPAQSNLYILTVRRNAGGVIFRLPGWS